MKQYFAVKENCFYLIEVKHLVREASKQSSSLNVRAPPPSSFMGVKKVKKNVIFLNGPARPFTPPPPSLKGLYLHIM